MKMLNTGYEIPDTKFMPVENNQDNFTKCGCEPCPSYNTCMSGGHQKLYCARDKSSCAVPMNGCLCGNCPVYRENKLTSGYYCTNGKAA